MAENNLKSIREPARDVPVVYEADVIVVGGGPGGHSAAVAAARNGAKTILIERYGCLGGMASGGLVILVLHQSDGFSNEPVIAGLPLEWMERLGKIPGGKIGPELSELGSTDPKVLARWKYHGSTVMGGRVRLSWTFDPEYFKCILNDMAEESGVKLSLHSWGTRAITEGNTVKGVIFESKSGRRAALGKVVIDGTGDGDLLTSAGAESDTSLDPKIRSANMALLFRLGGVNYEKYMETSSKDPAKARELAAELTKTAGTFFLPFPGNRPDTVWVNNWIPGFKATDVEDLTRLEVNTRKMISKGFAFMQQNYPGFENSFIMDIASQYGARGSRRLVGEYALTGDDVNSSRKFEDTIAIVPKVTVGWGSDMAEKGVTKRGDTCAYVPYRVLVPRQVDGLLVGCRCFSSDMFANDSLNLIPHCAALGEAAGTAAALAVKKGIAVRKVDIKTLQKTLAKNGSNLEGFV
jgi:hypothetical protein